MADGSFEVNGRAVDAGDFALILAGALAVEGRFVGESFVAVQPYVEGREAALQPVADPSRQWLWPIGIAFALGLVACYRSFWGGLAGAFRRRRARSRAEETPASASAHFAPLARQEEVNETEPAPTGAATVVLRAVLGSALVVARVLGRVTLAVLRLLWAGVEEIRSSR
jgi:hypothetical protein